MPTLPVWQLFNRPGDDFIQGPICGPGRGPLVRVRESVQVNQTPLPGTTIASLYKFTDPLPTFVGARVSGSNITVSAFEVQQPVLPASFYAKLPAPYNAGTYVWAYKVGGAPPNYPGFTIEAQRHIPTTVTYNNDLPLSPILQKYLTVDQTLHWADPLKEGHVATPYAGPPPLVAHLHGGEVPSAFDGAPEAWFTPGAALTGAAFSTNVYTYPNDQEATTLWFHDHTLGVTRTNVYAGLAAFYLVRDIYDTGVPGTGLNLPAGAEEIEIVIQDRSFDTNGQWLFPDNPENTQFHPYWIPEFVGDVMVVNGKAWPYLRVQPRRYRFRLLNGSNARILQLNLLDSQQRTTPPFWQISTDGGLLDRPVQIQTGSWYAGTFLAPGERADIIIDFSAYAGRTFTLTNAANVPYPVGVPVNPLTTGQVMQFRVDLPLVGADTSFNPAAPGATLRGGPNQPPLIVRLANPTNGTIASGVTVNVRRQLTLNEFLTTTPPDQPPAGWPIEILCNNTKWTGIREDGTIPPGFTPDGYGLWLSELPRVGATELWEIINLTADAHPMHLHLVQFQLVNRQNILTTYATAYAAAFPTKTIIGGYGPPLAYNTVNTDGAVGGNPPLSRYLQGSPTPPAPNEAGWKDVVIMMPGQVTRIIVRWAPQDVPVAGVSPGINLYPFDPTTGPGYVWHCHIIDHEDNEMMRPYAVTR
jgi:spore coat protein A